MELTHDGLQQAAHDHLLLHFSRNGAYGPDAASCGDGPRRGLLRLGHRSAAATSTGSRACSAAQIGYSYGAEMAEAATAQLSGCRSTRTGPWPTGRPIELAEKLAGVAPEGIETVFFTSGGSESVESAWKLVRQYHVANGERQRRKAIARDIAYHGVTLGALSFTGVGRLQGAVRHAARAHAPRLQHEPLPRARRARRRSFCARLLAEIEQADPGRGAGDGGDDHRRADAERRRLPHPARGLLAGAARDLPTGTGSCSWPTRSSPASAAWASGSASHRYGGAARPHHRRQGADLRVRADGRGARVRARGRAALRGRAHAAARHHLRRPSALRGDRAEEHGDLRARRRARERPRAGGLPGRPPATSCVRCRSSATCAARASSGRSRWCRTPMARRSRPRTKRDASSGVHARAAARGGLIARADDRQDAVLHVAPPLVADSGVLDEIVDAVAEVLEAAGDHMGLRTGAASAA